jgi:hypothetical protein
MRDRHYGCHWGHLDQSALVSANPLPLAVNAVSTVVLRFFDALLVPTETLGKAGGRESDGDPMAGNAIPLHYRVCVTNQTPPPRF